MNTSAAVSSGHQVPPKWSRVRFAFGEQNLQLRYCNTDVSSVSDAVRVMSVNAFEGAGGLPHLKNERKKS